MIFSYSSFFSRFLVSVRNVLNLLKLYKIPDNMNPINSDHQSDFESSNICQCLNPETCCILNTLPFSSRELLNTRHCQKFQNDLALSLCRNPHTLVEQIRNYEKQRQSDLKQLKIRLLVSQKKPDEVIDLFEELIAEYPEKFFYTMQLVNYQLADERKENDERKEIAETLLRGLVENHPEADEPKAWLIEFLLKNRGQEQAVAELQQFISADPDDFTSRSQLATFYVVKQEFDKAEALYQVVIDKDATSVDSLEARNRLVGIAFAQKDKAKAQKLLKEIFAIEPENTSALISRAKLKLTENDIDGAIPDLRVVLKNDPESVAALSLLARAHEVNNSPDLALDSYQRLLAIQPKSVPALLGAAKLLIAKSEPESALSLLESAQSFAPANSEVVRLLVDLYSREQRWDDAISTLAPLTENGDTMALGYYLKGRVLLRQKDYKGAVAALEKSYEIEPLGVETLNALTSSYVALEQMDKAFSFVEAHIKKYPDQMHAQEALGNLQLRDKDIASATKTYLHVLDKQPARMPIYKVLTRIYVSQQKLDEVEALYLKGLETVPDNHELRVMLAELRQAQGDYEAAMQEYETILKAKPDALLVKNNLAALMMDHANTPENLDRIKELAAELAATEAPAFLDTAGWAQYQLGNYAQAVSLLGAAVENGGKGAVYNYHLGMAYFKSDMKAQAKEQLELAVANKDAKFVGREEAESVLKSL